MKTWDHKTNQFYELLTKKEAVALGWAKESDNILGVRIVALPIPHKSIFEDLGIFIEGFDDFPPLEQIWN